MAILTDLQQKTLDVVRYRRRSNQVTGVEIANAIGLKKRSTGKEGADMRSIIHALRLKGFPICASGRGYYWAENKLELHTFIQSLQGRADELQAAIDGLGAGYVLLGGPGAEEAVKMTAEHRYMDAGIAYIVAGENEERFLWEHPNAQRL